MVEVDNVDIVHSPILSEIKTPTIKPISNIKNSPIERLPSGEININPNIINITKLNNIKTDFFIIFPSYFNHLFILFNIMNFIFIILYIFSIVLKTY